MTLLELHDLHVQFPTERGVVKAVDGVDLSIDHGEIVGLVGESGSGKSVLAESILGILESPGEITAGDIVFKGESLREKSEEEMKSVRGNSISMIFQDPMNSLTPVVSVGEQIAETIRLHQDTGESTSLPAEIKRRIFGATENSEAWRRAIDMLETVAIPEPVSRARDFPFEFSGGMRQRAMIAMALACEPDLLIADEPTTALDVTVQAQIIDELVSILEEFDASVLLITHDLAVVAELCTTVDVMYAGEILEESPADKLFNNPSHPYTEALLQTTPTVARRKQELTPIPGTVPDLIDIDYACHFAPRCPEATEECFDVDPDFREVNDEHEVACLHRGTEEVIK